MFQRQMKHSSEKYLSILKKLNSHVEKLQQLQSSPGVPVDKIVSLCENFQLKEIEDYANSILEEANQKYPDMLNSYVKLNSTARNFTLQHQPLPTDLKSTVMQALSDNISKDTQEGADRNQISINAVQSLQKKEGSLLTQEAWVLSIIDVKQSLQNIKVSNQFVPKLVSAFKDDPDEQRKYLSVRIGFTKALFNKLEDEYKLRENLNPHLALLRGIVTQTKSSRNKSFDLYEQSDEEIPDSYTLEIPSAKIETEEMLSKELKTLARYCEDYLGGLRKNIIRLAKIAKEEINSTIEKDPDTPSRQLIEDLTSNPINGDVFRLPFHHPLLDALASTEMLEEKKQALTHLSNLPEGLRVSDVVKNYSDKPEIKAFVDEFNTHLNVTLPTYLETIKCKLENQQKLKTDGEEVIALQKKYETLQKLMKLYKNPTELKLFTIVEDYKNDQLENGLIYPELLNDLSQPLSKYIAKLNDDFEMMQEGLEERKKNYREVTPARINLMRAVLQYQLLNKIKSISLASGPASKRKEEIEALFDEKKFHYSINRFALTSPMSNPREKVGLGRVLAMLGVVLLGGVVIGAPVAYFLNKYLAKRQLKIENDLYAIQDTQRKKINGQLNVVKRKR